jgi:signal transduction histidine kinase
MRARVGLADVVLGAVLTASGGAIALLGSAPVSTRLVAALALPSVTLPVVWRRVAPLACATALAAGAIVSGVPTFAQSRCGVAIPAALLVLFAAASRRPARTAAISLALVLAGVAFLASTDPDVGASALVFLVSLCLVVWIAGVLTRAHAELAAALESRSAELAATRADAGRIALEIERARIIEGVDGPLRESLGQITVAARTAAGGDAVLAFTQIELLAREALADLRAVLGDLRSDPERSAIAADGPVAPASSGLRHLYPPAWLHASQRWDIALAALLTIVGVGEIVADDAHRLLLSALLLAAACATLTQRARRPAWAAAVAGAVLAAGAAAGGIDYPLTVLVLVLVLSYACGAHEPLVRGAAGALALLGGVEAAALAGGGAWVPLLVSASAPFLAGLAVRRRQALVDTLRELNGELLSEHARIRELTVRRERTRVARDLHDAIAHHLTVISLQAGAGRLTGDRTHLASIRTSGQLALAEMDVIGAVISATRDALGAPSVRAAIGQARAAGLTVAAAIGDDRPLSDELELLAYRVVQEGLTNAIRHAPGAGVEVLLELVDGVVHVEVTNGAAVGPPTGEAGSGSGLTGMRARVETAGGRLEHAALDDRGWRLSAWLPAGVTPTTGPVGASTLPPREELTFAMRDDDTRGRA